VQDASHTAKDLNGPPRWPSRRALRAGFASLEGTHLPRGGSVPFEGVRSPRAGSAPLEGPLPLGQTSPRSRARLALNRGPLRSRAPRSRAPAPVRWAFNVLTPARQCHHAPGARAPVPPYQLPRREPIPIIVGRDCAARPVSVP
jgi:hypothetical protein